MMITCRDCPAEIRGTLDIEDIAVTRAGNLPRGTFRPPADSRWRTLPSGNHICPACIKAVAQETAAEAAAEAPMNEMGGRAGAPRRGLLMRQVTVRSSVLGPEHPESTQAASLATCSCGCELFNIFQLAKHPHSHFQCADCSASYCPSGTCPKGGSA